MKQSEARQVWILAPGSLGPMNLGPTLRVIQMARLARDDGHTPVIALENGTSGTFEGIRTEKLSPKCVYCIPQSAAIIATATLHPAIFREILRRNQGFDLDMYGMGAIEHMEFPHIVHPFRIFQGRRRLKLRYQILAREAERIYLSNQQQLAFLGGILFSNGSQEMAILASALPAKVLFLPFGAKGKEDPTIFANPYPENIQKHFIFLWGGGIWPWFDINTLLEAFKLLKDRNIPAALYFIGGKNLSGIKSMDAPIRVARDTAQKLGLLNQCVVFNETGIPADEIPMWVEHCHAGIMANPNRLESLCSWRTRLLDLLNFGKPVISLGFDPLSKELEAHGAALQSPEYSAQSLADTIEKFCNEQELRSRLSKNSERCASKYTWEHIFTPWKLRLRSPFSFQPCKHKVTWREAIRFVIGI